MIRPIFAANWKLHHAQTEARAFIRTFLVRYPRHHDRSVIFFPSALAVHAVVEALHERPDILVGVQDIYWEQQGAFTGENSVAQARDAGARVALVGHSERRHLFGETDEDTGKKCVAAFRGGLIPMLCVGETLAERERGAATDVVARQLRAGTTALDAANIAKLIIAYEPVWAIGTGRNATPGDASEMHDTIRSELRRLGGERGATVPVLYGGSVTRTNAAELLGAEGVDGLLVGGASLDPDGWSSITRT
jgi:triosephosphate isomerase